MMKKTTTTTKWEKKKKIKTLKVTGHLAKLLVLRDNKWPIINLLRWDFVLCTLWTNDLKIGQMAEHVCVWESSREQFVWAGRQHVWRMELGKYVLFFFFFISPDGAHNLAAKIRQ